MTKIFIYDTETSGLDTRYARPTQFAAVTFDQQGNALREINLRGRLPLHVLPSPGALLVTQQSMSQVQGSALSHHEFITKIRNLLIEEAPAIITSYNGLRYDEEVLRHSFYANLYPPYLTQFNGNTRMDVMVAAQLTAACAPERLVFPRNAKGKKSFKLEHLAAANGFADHVAHDALGDVMATMHVAQTIRCEAKEVWGACIAMRSKDAMRSLMESRAPVLQLQWHHGADRAIVRVVLPITTDEMNPNEWLCVNLAADIDSLITADVATLRESFNSIAGLKGIVPIKTNAMPLVMRLDDPLAQGTPTNYDPARIGQLLSDSSFVSRLRAASTLRKSEYDEPVQVWEQLYSGGFFPTAEDEPTIRAFHDAPPPQKYEMIRDLRDARARHIARWMIGSEWPAVMTVGDREAVEDEFREHLMADSAAWTTIPSALEEIRVLRQGASPQEGGILDDYEAHLSTLQNRPLNYAAE